jgi:excisionase family DNA binding protein
VENVSELLCTIMEEAKAVAPDKIPSILAQLAAVQNALVARLLSGENYNHHQPGGHEEDRLIIVAEAAKRLGFTPQYLYEMLRKGQFPCIRQGKYVRVRLSDLSAWIDEHREKGLDKQLCHWHSISNGTKRTATNKKKTRAHPSSNGRQNRHNLKRFGTAGTRRAENLGTDIPTGQAPDSDRIDG